MSMPYDNDGAGDWTVAGLHTEYTPEEWKRVSRGFGRRGLKSKVYGLHVIDRVPSSAEIPHRSWWYRITEWWFAL